MQAYSDPRRESDPHALPDLEVWEVTEADCREDRRHFENPADADFQEPGWYWWSCSPGCLPDSDPAGPFETQEEALADARESYGLCPHGTEDDEVCEECPAPELWTLQDASGRCLVFSMTSGPLDKASVSAWATQEAAIRIADAINTPSMAAGALLKPVRLSDEDARKWGRS